MDPHLNAVPGDARRLPVRARISKIVVVIPACNEQATISPCLSSIAESATALPPRIDVDIVVVADSCTDDTARLASEFEAVTVVEARVRCAGHARRLGTEFALSNLVVAPESVWLACTDADTVVPADWLTRQLAHEASGFCGVTGIVKIDPTTSHPDLGKWFREYYRVGDDGTHRHVHGANIGFRCDAYLDAGGWKPLRTGEDHDLWNRISSRWPTRSNASLTVRTSARLSGRAPAGFARDLDRLVARSGNLHVANHPLQGARS